MTSDAQQKKTLLAIYKKRVRGVAVALAMPLTLGLCGCPSAISPLGKPAASFSTATATVVENSENAYATANRLYFNEQMSAAVLEYDKQPNWDPHSVKPLLTPDQLAVRTTLLEALKVYAAEVDSIANTGTTKADELDTASAAVGNNLVGLSSTVADVSGIAALKLSQEHANELSVAVRVLGQFLIAHKVRKDLGPMIVQMDPSITAICRVLQTDISTLQSQAANDYSNMLTQQDLFIRRSGAQLSPVEKRVEIRRMPLLIQKAQATDELLSDLKSSIGKLAAAHHALASTAVGGNPETLSARIADLVLSARSLATFYQSLPSS